MNRMQCSEYSTEGGDVTLGVCTMRREINRQIQISCGVVAHIRCKYSALIF